LRSNSFYFFLVFGVVNLAFKWDKKLPTAVDLYEEKTQKVCSVRQNTLGSRRTGFYKQARTVQYLLGDCLIFMAEIQYWAQTPTSKEQKQTAFSWAII
jgi:hypothetical protein